jgi:hypothetical protein
MGKSVRIETEESIKIKRAGYSVSVGKDVPVS